MAVLGAPLSSRRDKWTGIICIVLWMILSSDVILLNKWILDRFPFSITLTTWHMLFATVATQVLSRTTNLINRKAKMDTKLYLKAIVPIGMCFSMSLILSNMTYLYLSMAFIQMLKALSPVATLLACWSMGIRNPQPSMRVLLTVCVIVSGVAVSSVGEFRVVPTGIMIQGAAVVFEAYKSALQQYLLAGEAKLDPLTLLYYFAPVCTLINGCYILIFEAAHLRTFPSTQISLWVFLINGLLSFGLNIASVTVIKKTSSLVLTLSSIPKSILLLGVDVVIYRNPMTVMQGVGFSIAGAGTYHYSRLKNPEALRDGEAQKFDGAIVEKQ